jgi:FMN phosphatase YigB (HAD superfamily)
MACEDIWFVRDRSDTDITGAKAAGMKAFYSIQKIDGRLAMRISRWRVGDIW